MVIDYSTTNYAGFDVHTPAEGFPVTLEMAADHLRTSGAACEESLVELYLGSATEYLEQHYSLCFLTQTMKEYYTAFPGDGKVLRLRSTPIQTVTVSYTDEAGTATPFTDFDLVRLPGNRYGLYPKPGKTWPDSDKVHAQGITVTVSAGYTSEANVPKNIKLAILLMTGLFYENRENMDFVQENTAVRSIMRPFEVNVG